MSGDVTVWARGRSLHELSGLRVTARIISPTGARRTIRLHDDDPLEPESGA